MVMPLFNLYKAIALLEHINSSSYSLLTSLGSQRLSSLIWQLIFIVSHMSRGSFIHTHSQKLSLFLYLSSCLSQPLSHFAYLDYHQEYTLKQGYGSHSVNLCFPLFAYNSLLDSCILVHSHIFTNSLSPSM